MFLFLTTYIFADPLSVQVKSLYLLSHPHDAERLNWTDKRDFKGLLKLWEQLLENKPWWAEVFSKAELLDYDAVGKMLSARFQLSTWSVRGEGQGASCSGV